MMNIKSFTYGYATFIIFMIMYVTLTMVGYRL